MKSKRALKNQKGFTLIEIIAVLVILGILAAVAIPKFLDLQNDAKKASAKSAVAAGQSAVSMGYASYLLNPTGTNTPAGPSAACAKVTLDAPTGVTYTVGCTGATWAVTNSTVTGTYDTQTATGTWTRP
jgi:prepilin-type N-terminal cleavage/methylation domain-containing protein